MGHSEEIESLKKRVEKLEADLAEAEKQRDFYKHVLDNSEIVISVVDLKKQRFIFFNEKNFRISGYSRKDFEEIGDLSKAAAFFAEEDRHKMPAQIMETIASKKPVSQEFWNVKKDGSNIRLVYTTMATFDEVGEPEYLIASGIDVTGRWEAEQELRQSEERYRKLFETAPEPIAIHAGGKIIAVNRAGAELAAAKSPEDLIGRDVVDFFHPSMREAIVERMRGIYDTQSTPPMMVQKYLRLDGETLDLEVVSGHILYHGRPAIQAFMRDVTDKKRLERELADSEKRWQNLVENAPDPVVVYVDGLMTYVNKATLDFIGAKKPEDLMGRSVFDFIHPDYHPTIAERIRKMKETGEPAGLLEAKYIRFNGEEIFAEVSSAPIMYRGKPAFQATLRDTTLRRKLQQELHETLARAEEATKLKDKFVALVAHDLKSPIIGLHMGLELLGEDSGLDKARKKTITSFAGHCKGLLELIDRLLDINRLQTGKIKVLKKLVRVQLLADSRISPLLATAKSKGIAVINNLPPDMLVFADFDLFGECLSNLVSNAIKFSKKGGTIELFSPDDGMNVIAISDVGVGIPSEHIPNLFNAEYKTTSKGTAGEKGTGLGLPYCNDIMEAHGGKITVKSEVGKGSVFYLALPAQKPTALVVDDEETVRMVVGSHLDELGLEVVEAGDGNEALEVLKKTQPQLIVTDISMPGMHGLDLIKAVKDSQEHRDIPIMVITALGAETTYGMETRDYAFRWGCDDFIYKPFGKQEFMARVGRILGKV